MSQIQIFLNDLEQEAQTTRKMLSRVPNDKYSWKPHEKSMTIKQLATHIAELPSWISMALTTDGLDFEANPYNPKDLNHTDELLAYFEESYEDGKAHLEKANEEELPKPWILRSGEKVLGEYDKAGVIRMSLNQIVHHRAQLGVYLRLLNIPIPGSYGPSADEMG